MITSSGSRTGLPNSNESERNIQRLVDTSIEVDSSDDVAFVEVLDSVGRGLACSFLSYVWQGGVSTKLSRISRRKISM